MLQHLPSPWGETLPVLPHLRLAAWEYALPCRVPLPVGRHLLINQRRGFLVRIASPDGRIGWGDVAPLPGLHAESLDHAWGQIMQAAEWMRAHGTDAQRLVSCLSSLAPSVRWGLDTALDDWRLAGESTAAWRDARVSINGLFTLGADPKVAFDKIRSGCGTLKVKVGGRAAGMTWQTEVAALKALRSEVGDGVRLRLDANRAWSLSEAIQFGRAVEGLGIEYIEEPLQVPSELERFYEGTGLGYAWDETLRERARAPVMEAVPPRGLRAIILKPALLNGMPALERSIRWADRAGLQWIVTSCFESGVGLRNLARACWLHGSGSRAMGLGTSDYFSDDILEAPGLVIDGGGMDLGKSFEAAVRMPPPGGWLPPDAVMGHGGG